MKADLALITGATSGIGELLAIELTKQKIPLILVGRNKEKLENFLTEHPDVQVICADLTDVEDRARVIECIEKNTPDLLINAAGAARYGEVLEKPLGDELKVFELNANVPIELSVAAAKALLKKQKPGVILNISSIAAYFTFPYMAMYASAKSALTHFSESFHEELKRFGISVLVSSPGKVNTSFAKRASNLKEFESRSFAMSKEYAVRRILRQIVRRKPVNDAFNWMYRAFCFASKILPKSFFLYFFKQEMRKLYTKSPDLP